MMFGVLQAVMTLFSGCAVLYRFAVGLLPRPNPPSPGEGALDGFPRLIPKEALFIAGGI